MIFFLVLKNHSYTIDIFIHHSKQTNCKVINYEDNLALNKILSTDLVVFCDIDRCDQLMLADLKDVYQDLFQRGCIILNNPYKVLARFDLCAHLYEKGINRFKLHRESNLELINYPVFIREEFEHNGALSYLINNKQDLDLALQKLNNYKQLIISEFVDVSQSEWGCYHKYGAFYINGVVIPRHFFISDDWNVKQNSLDIDLSNRFEKEYLETNPHEIQIADIFKMANIDYGRIDYAMTIYGMQVFEINTNPTVIDNSDLDESSPRYEHTLQFEKKFSQVLDSLKRSNLNF